MFERVIRRALTLNQRAQGSNPCTPTSQIKYIRADRRFPLSFRLPLRLRGGQVWIVLPRSQTWRAGILCQQSPVLLVADVCNRKAIVLDPFGGSGTTIMAAEE